MERRKGARRHPEM
uniref:Uncharacterized protein n=1 Tax=Arundo donax TaxID=35708 RepID=A0A0A9AJ09_ARUDO